MRFRSKRRRLPLKTLAPMLNWRISKRVETFSSSPSWIC